MSKKNKTSAFTAKTETFNPDYSETKRDLKRIGLLAGIFVALLVTLSFFQEQLLALFIK